MEAYDPNFHKSYDDDKFLTTYSFIYVDPSESTEKFLNDPRVFKDGLKYFGVRERCYDGTDNIHITVYDEGYWQYTSKEVYDAFESKIVDHTSADWFMKKDEEEKRMKLGEMTVSQVKEYCYNSACRFCQFVTDNDKCLFHEKAAEKWNTDLEVVLSSEKK